MVNLPGFTVDGIWHTGVYAFGREYYFVPEGSSADFPGIKNSTPEEFQKKTGYSPTQTIRMGTTTKTREEFEQYLLTISVNMRFPMFEWSKPCVVLSE